MLTCEMKSNETRHTSYVSCIHDESMQVQVPEVRHKFARKQGNKQLFSEETVCFVGDQNLIDF